MTTQRTSRRVLVADDDSMVRHLVRNLIEKEGYMAVVVDDGREAYRLLQNDADFCGAVIDIKMPNLEGLELIRFMRTEKRLMRIPAMMITSEPDLRTMADCFAAGASLFLPKPFTSEQFQNTFRLLLNSHLAATQNSPINMPFV